jgi:type VI protein secretion system component Hcp
MKGLSLRRLALPVLAAVVTSAVVAAYGLATDSATKVGAPPAAVAGQVIGQLTVDGIGTMPIASYSWGVSNPVTIGGIGGGASAGKASFSSLSFMRTVDSMSSALFTASATGRHIPHAVFTAEWGTGNATTTAKYELDDVFVESVQQSRSGGSAASESLSLAYERVTWTVSDGSGTTSGSWNLAENRQ